MIGRIFIFLSFIVFTVSAAGESRKVLDLYYTLNSAPCRAVLLTVKRLDLYLNLRRIQIDRTPQFMKINPQFTLPVLVDDKLTIAEGHAISVYLALKYTKNDSLFPRDAEEMTIVLERLFFNAGSLFPRFTNFYDRLIKGVQDIDEQKEELNEAIKYLNEYLKESEYVAGDQVTVADLNILASITTIQAIDYDFSEYPRIGEWIEKTKALFSRANYEEANNIGVERFRKVYLDHLQPKN